MSGRQAWESANFARLLAAHRLGEAFAFVREASGLSQMKFAEKVGRDRRYVGKVESGELRTLERIPDFMRWARALEIPPEMLTPALTGSADGVAQDGRPKLGVAEECDDPAVWSIGTPTDRTDEQNAMSPLDRRSLIKSGLAAAALPALVGDPLARVLQHGSRSGQNSSLPTTPWSEPIRYAVLHPAETARLATDTKIGELRLLAHQARAAELASDYARLAAWLPWLIAQLESAAFHGTDDGDWLRLRASVYEVAGWALIKADDPMAAWVAAQRAVDIALTAGHSLSAGAATRCLAEVHMRARRHDEAIRTGLLAVVQVDSASALHKEEALRLKGGALLSTASAAARSGNSREAYTALNTAAAYADQIGDDSNSPQSDFCAANVAIHRVAVPTELGDARAAAANIAAVDLNRMPRVLRERRARFLIDVARVHVALDDHDSAVDALLQAEAIAPDELRNHWLTRDLLATLLARERRSSGLRELAARCQSLN